MYGLAEVREDERDAVAVAGLLRDLVGLEEERERARVVALVLRDGAEVVERDGDADEIADLAADAQRLLEGVERELELARVLVDEPEVVRATARSIGGRRACGAWRARAAWPRARAGSRRAASSSLPTSSTVRAMPRSSFESSKRPSADSRLELRVVEATGVAVESTDARVRGAALGLQVQAVRADEHLVERVERLVVAAEHLEHVAVVVERAKLLLGRALGAVTEKREALHVVLGRLAFA